MQKIDEKKLGISYHEMFQPFPLSRNLEQLKKAAAEHNIPEQDAILIALNASGIKNGDIENDRGRFTIVMPDGKKYFLAMTITNKPLSPFEHRNGEIYFGNEKIADIGEIEEDTCSDSYWRGNKTHLTLNSNSRSNCKGCEFCGTYSLRDDDKALNTPEALRRKAEELCQEVGGDLSSLESIGVVTGCFPNEKSLVSHLRMVRSVFAEYGFNKELRYIGSQLRSKENLALLASEGPFALYLTVESFTRREQLMKKAKASLNLEMGRELLQLAKELGIETTFLYIAGLDDLSSMESEFPKYSGLLTRLPLAQTFQAYVPEQLEKRHPSASSVEYFLKTRTIIEKSFPDLRPQAFSNYRGLWYTKYAEEELPNTPI